MDSSSALVVYGSIAGGLVVLLAIAVLVKRWAVRREEKARNSAKAQYTPVIQVDILCKPHGMVGEARCVGGGV